jgi:minor fimbrial subunit
MKKMKIGLVVGLLMMVFATVSQADDATITVYGKVVAMPCTISTTSATVDLGNLFTYNLVSAGASSPWQDVTLNLISCPAGTSTVTASFSGTADAISGYYKNLGAAANIQLELQDSNGNQLGNGATKQIPINGSTLSASFPLKVRAKTVNGNATQGSIQAVINVTYTYA